MSAIQFDKKQTQKLLFVKELNAVIDKKKRIEIFPMRETSDLYEIRFRSTKDNKTYTVTQYKQPKTYTQFIIDVDGVINTIETTDRASEKMMNIWHKLHELHNENYTWNMTGGGWEKIEKMPNLFQKMFSKNKVKNK